MPVSFLTFKPVEQRQGVHMVFIDLSKAFHTVDRSTSCSVTKDFIEVCALVMPHCNVIVVLLSTSFQMSVFLVLNL